MQTPKVRFLLLAGASSAATSNRQRVRIVNSKVTGATRRQTSRLVSAQGIKDRPRIDWGPFECHNCVFQLKSHTIPVEIAQHSAASRTPFRCEAAHLRPSRAES